MKYTHSITSYRATLLLTLFFLFSCDNKEAQQIPIGKVTKGTFYIDLYEEGEIEAVNSINILSPDISWRYGNLKITQIVRDGKEVAKGDTLVIFDPSEVERAIVEAEGQLEISQAELEKMKAQHESDLEDLNVEYEVTRISYEISKIRVESAVYESEIAKREIELNLEQAKISLDRAKEQIENRIKVQEEEIRQQNFGIERNRQRLEEGYKTLELLVLTSPSPGIAIIGENWSTGNKFQVGDQCWSGMPLILLPDLSSLKTTAKINEVDISKIAKGQQVEIKPDAFSDSTFTGKVISVANLAVNKDNESRVKVFPIEVLINETNKNLLPGLTVSCRILVDQIENTLYVPIDAIFSQNGEHIIYKKSGKNFTAVKVELGASNSDYTIITKGLKEGDEIALINPYPEEEKKEKKNSETEEVL
ncbi:MAG: efflux RND transporter periplasmic adaptor subunit [Bacteroides sp.]|nr:efflux RND transporter periplasmic adaptor subunit [Bacteroides sp.]